jgi:alkaline phosphatase D
MTVCLLTHASSYDSTSCLGPANRPWPSLSRAAAQRLDFLVAGGDTVYADGDITAGEYRGTWSNAMRVAGLADAAASTSVVAAWDDHEIDNDWSTRSTTPTQRSAAKRAFKEALPAFYGDSSNSDAAQLAYATDDARLYRRLRYGPVDVFVLDCRGERVPANKTYISPAQMTWLLDGLADSDAPFKVIVNSGSSCDRIFIESRLL